MSESTTGESIQQAARTIADGVSNAASHASTAASQASDGITEFRAVVRGQPITMAFVMLAMGYLLGSITHTRPPRR